MSNNYLFALACSVLIHSVAWGQTPSENLIEDPQPASVNLKAKRIDPDPKFKVPVGTKVRMQATHEPVSSPTYIWGERCVPITASLNHEDWNTATIEFCAPTPGMGEFQVELTHASPQYENGVIAKCTVVWEPPDEVVVQLGPVTNKGDGWYYCPHTYTIKSIGKPIGKCAELCVQESVTWEAKNAFRRFQPVFDSIQVPRWWPPCPCPNGGLYGNSVLKQLLTWKWSAPKLHDMHGLLLSDEMLQLIQGLELGTLLAVETQELGVCWYNCGGNPDVQRLPIQVFVFDWIVDVDPQTGFKRPKQVLVHHSVPPHNP